MAASEHALFAEGLKKRFGSQKVLEGLDFTVRRGAVLGLLGPNGAGKTTTVKILSTLLKPDGGRAEVNCFDVVKDAQKVRASIGLTGQYAAVDTDCTRPSRARKTDPIPSSCWTRRTPCPAKRCWSSSA